MSAPPPTAAAVPATLTDLEPPVTASDLDAPRAVGTPVDPLPGPRTPVDLAPRGAAPRSAAGGLLLAAAAAGALAPALVVGAPPPPTAIGPAGAVALLGLLGAAALARGLPAPATRAVLGGAAGLLAGVVGAHAPPGVGHALLGLGLGLASVAPGTRPVGALGAALALAVGALLGGVLAGLVAPALAGLPAGLAGLALGVCHGLGLTCGDALRRLRVVDLAPPADATALATSLADPEARAAVLVALDAHRRCALHARAQRDRRAAADLMDLARDLVARTAAAAREAERSLVAARSLGGAGDVPAGLSAELDEARGRLGTALAVRRREALAAATRHAAALTHVAAALVEGASGLGLERAADLDADLGRRAARAEKAALA